ncbi:hypothetical protein CAEBREN_25820 [Caenorhabditis brenneri]|uniref:CUB-like domain-containing protein n=1 Tax=Caenorhabditis brenneri TaxID=135651 RepID=G0PL03_CAEBE|nr:hypothetical protein CAEBREN_25820 [Caenorhabditis brenneri]
MLSSSDLVPSTATPCVTTITAPKGVRLVGFEPNYSPIANLRLWLIFEGDSINNRYIGNLYDVYSNSDANSYTLGKQVTIYKFNEIPQDNLTLYLGMDVQASGNVKFFRGLVCSLYCQINLDSTYAVNALITVSNDVDYLGKFKHFPTDSNLRIYEGQINDDHLLATVNSSNVLQTLPMAVKSSIKIYVLDKEKINMYLYTNPDDVSYSLVYAGRYINIRSFDVGQISLQQDTFENFTTGDVYTLVNFNFNVTYFDLSGPSTTMQITVFRAGNEVFYGKYFQGNTPPSTTIKVLGDSMIVNYRTDGAATKGFRVDLLCTGEDQTSTIDPVKGPTTSALTTTKQFPPSSTRLTTEKYDTTTKSSDSQFSSILFLFIGIFLILW